MEEEQDVALSDVEDLEGVLVNTEDEEDLSGTLLEEELPRDDEEEAGEGGLELTYIKPPRNEVPGWSGDPAEYYNEYDGEESLYFPPPPANPSWDISQMVFESSSTALPFAEYILQTLEEDLADYVAKTGIVFPVPEEELILTRKRRPSEISLSIKSDVSIPLQGEPSRLRLVYEKGDSEFRETSMGHLDGTGMDVAAEANIHRSKNWKRIGMTKMHHEAAAQTKEMTYLTEPKAQLVYLDMYPRSDDWKPPKAPVRKASLATAVAEAEKADPQIDRSRKGPQIINFTNRKKILPPLRDDYHKDESFWTGSRFRGEYRNRQFHKGHYDHPTGVTYESEWRDGHFHTKNHLGVLIYPRGDKFEGEWDTGRYTSGQITFADGLVYKNKNWAYCEAPDRRLKIEKKYGLKPAGNAIYNDQYPQTHVSPGCYDVGDGIYYPKTGEIRGYDGFFLRNANAMEHNWIIQNCRKTPEKGEEYIPSFNVDRFPGSYIEQLQRFSIAKRKYH